MIDDTKQIPSLLPTRRAALIDELSKGRPTEIMRKLRRFIVVPRYLHENCY